MRKMMNLKMLAPLLAVGLFLSLLAAGHARAEELTLMAVGDVLPHPSWQQFEISTTELLKDVNEKFFEADVVMGNLESPLTDKEEYTTSKSAAALRFKKDFVFKAEDPDAATGLMGAGFTVMTLSNNHMLDYREAGLLDTLARLKEAGITTAGGGKNYKDSIKPGIVKMKGMEVVVLAASDIVPKGFGAEADKPGIVSMKNDKAFMKHIKAVRKEHPDAIIVLSLHWGVEAALSPTTRQKNLAHGFMDAGADLIIGHGPHRVQGVELYNGKPIFYSLGNFQFDSEPPGDESVIAKVVYKDGAREPVSTAVIPVFIEPGGYPRVLSADEEHYAHIAADVARLSGPLGATLDGLEVAVLPPSSDYGGLEDVGGELEGELDAGPDADEAAGAGLEAEVKTGRR